MLSDHPAHKFAHRNLPHISELQRREDGKLYCFVLVFSMTAQRRSGHCQPQLLLIIILRACSATARWQITATFHNDRRFCTTLVYTLCLDICHPCLLADRPYILAKMPTSAQYYSKVNLQHPVVVERALNTVCKVHFPCFTCLMCARTEVSICSL